MKIPRCFILFSLFLLLSYCGRLIKGDDSDIDHTTIFYIGVGLKIKLSKEMDIFKNNDLIVKAYKCAGDDCTLYPEHMAARFLFAAESFSKNPYIDRLELLRDNEILIFTKGFWGNVKVSKRKNTEYKTVDPQSYEYYKKKFIGGDWKCSNNHFLSFGGQEFGAEFILLLHDRYGEMRRGDKVISGSYYYQCDVIKGRCQFFDSGDRFAIVEILGPGRIRFVADPEILKDLGKQFVSFKDVKCFL